MIKQIFAVLLTFFSISSTFSQFEVIETFTNASLVELDYYNNECFIVGGEYYLAKCGQNGENLQTLVAPGITNNRLHSFNRIDTNLAFIVSVGHPLDDGYYQVFRTRDNAETWESIYDSLSYNPGSLIMFDSLEGIFDNGTPAHYLSRTIDACSSYNAEPFPYYYLDLWDKLDDSVLCAGFVESFTISYDRGNTWITGWYPQPEPKSHDMISRDTILSTAFGYFLKTIDHGINWEEHYLPLLTNKVKHFRGDTIYIVGALGVQDEFGNYISHGSISRSLDFGETWSTYDTGLETEFLDIEFTNDSVALISGTNGVLIKYNFRDHHLGFKEPETGEIPLKLFPNPTNDLQELSIKTEPGKQINIRLLDLSGKVVRQLFQGLTGQTLSLDLSAFETGLYFISVEIENKVYILKTQKK
ncbi:MAG: T9SS type A sorting domain-containing protein [Bacteroidota bacterium]